MHLPLIAERVSGAASNAWAGKAWAQPYRSGVGREMEKSFGTTAFVCCARQTLLGARH